ncbi:MAG: SDR family oxidoreductase [bacterium]|nr:SDR family oxidoreductase [bacterium]
MVDLTGKVAVVTGGSGVLGTVMCHALADAGAQVAVLATTREKIDAVVGQIQARRGTAMGVTADVTDRTALQTAADVVMNTFGRVDVLVNAAGGNRPDATTGAKTLFELPQSGMDQVFALNYNGTLIASQVFGQIMVAQQSGNMINISSMASMRPLTRVAVYGAAKAAVNNLTQWLAVHMAKEYSPNIRVNAIAPGFFVGDQNRYLLYDEQTGELTPRGRQIIDHTPLGRFGNPEDLIGTLLWLASDDSRFVTGIVVPVDGGFSAFSGV